MDTNNKTYERKKILVIRKRLNKINDFMISLTTVKFILLALLLNIIINTVISPLFMKYPILDDYTQPIIVFRDVFRAVIIAPIVETFIFQMTPIFTIDAIFLLRSNEEKVRITPIVISALLFGIFHYFDYYNSLIKFISTFSIGLVLAYAYELYRVEGRKPFSVTAIIHGLTNLIFYMPALIIQISN